MSVVHDKFLELLPEIKKRTADNVLSMCYEINKDSVIDKYISPEYKTMKAKGLFNRNNRKYSALNRLSVKYKFSFMEDKEQNGTRLYSLGIDIDNSFANFIDNINNIMSESKDRFYSFSRDILITPNVFSMFAGKIFKPKVDKFTQIDLTFENATGEITISCTDKNVPQSLLDELSSITSRNAKRFEGPETELRAVIRRIENWCASEITGSIERERSLDEILNIQ